MVFWIAWVLFIVVLMIGIVVMGWPLLLIRASGLRLPLLTFYQLQASGWPMVHVLRVMIRFKKAGVTTSWDDIEWFLRSATDEIQNQPGLREKTPVGLLTDVLEAIQLVASEGYILSFQQAVMMVLKGRSSREIAGEFIHLMWTAEGKSRK